MMGGRAGLGRGDQRWLISGGNLGSAGRLEQCDFVQASQPPSELFCKMGTSIPSRLWPGLTHTVDQQAQRAGLLECQQHLS